MHVEIWSDVACPWCYVGKRRLEAALERFEHRDEVTVTWRSFELDPGAPAERPGGGAEHLSRKYATTLERAREMEQSMTTVAAADGLEFRFDRLRLGNMFDAHRVLHLAHEHDVQDAAKERFLRAYLTEGELMSDHATLRRLATEVGLPADEVADLLSSDRFADAVREDERTATGLGIAAVPFFVVDRARAASGAQDPDVLLDLLQTAWAARTPALETVPDGAACGPDGC